MHARTRTHVHTRQRTHMYARVHNISSIKFPNEANIKAYIRVCVLEDNSAFGTYDCILQ